MADLNTVIEGTVKFRDGKKWKSRWCVMRKLSPVADCLHLQLYRDSKDRYKKGQTKASLSLQHFLGYEAGFTLDKESNTIAIICQDIVVVLAFDTRERLIQWQVKISNNLGDGQQYLILVSSAPSKSKVPSGPAKLHIQDHKFCMTTGVPPRLVGIWEIAHLRRYGVVEGRFCFEGGSYCGRGEGLHILVTEQGDEISDKFLLASQGKLTAKRRTQPNKKSTITDSPKTQKSYRPDTRLSDLNTIDKSLTTVEINNILYEDTYFGDDTGPISPYWPSAESQTCRHADVDSNYGCGDTVSVGEAQDTNHDDVWPGQTVTLERCMSCISKLGAMSRSSTATAAMTPCGGTYFNPAWTMESLKENQPAFDGASTSSKNSSSGSAEYSIPRLLPFTSSTLKSTIEKSVKSPLSPTTTCEINTCKCPNYPPRPPKAARAELGKKPPMPLPVEKTQCICRCNNGSEESQEFNNPRAGPYENYDVPKMTHTEGDNCDNTFNSEYYDTPKKLKECLSNDLFRVTKSAVPGTLVLKKPCGCILKFGKKKNQGPTIIDCDDSNLQPADCPCQRVTNWANNWITMPYCRRNADDVNNIVVKSDKENSIPNAIPNDRNALYATIDVSRKTNRKSNYTNPSENNLSSAEKEAQQQIAMNYENIEPVDEEETDGPLANYENLDFALSLEYYENAKDLLKKAGVTQTELDALSANLNPISFALKNGKSLCTKCGHPQLNSNANGGVTCTASKCRNDDYLMMEPNKLNKNNKPEQFNKCMKNYPGYTPMSPITNITSHTLKSSALKNRVNRLIEEKSASNPTLFGPPVDRSKKRSESDMRIPGAAMLMNLNSPNSPYARRQVMDSSDSINMLKNRKRSCSADSSRYLEDVKEFDSSMGSRATSSSLETLRNISIDNRRSSSPCIHQENEYCEDVDCCTKAYDTKTSDVESETTSKELPQLRRKFRENAQIKRSSSVPCKSGQNRDSSSSNDSGVSSCSLKHGGPEFTEFELPLTTATSSSRHRRVTAQRQLKGNHIGCLHASLPRRSKSSDPLRELTFHLQRVKFPAKSSSAEAEVPVCPSKAIKGIIDSHSTSSGTSDMSDYIETLSMSSSQSSSDAPTTLRINRQATTTLRPRSGKEYHNIDQTIITSVYKTAKEMANYTNL